MVYGWATKEFENEHPTPRGEFGSGLPPAYTQLKSGSAKGKAAGLCKSGPAIS
jgi:hypothetical protein